MRTPNTQPKREAQAPSNEALKKAQGRRIAEARSRKGLSQKALADLLGISAGAVGQWEIGKTEPDTMDRWQALSSVLGVTLGWLRTGEEEEADDFSQKTLDPVEWEWLERFRLAEPDVRDVLMKVLRTATQETTDRLTKELVEHLRQLNDSDRDAITRMVRGMVIQSPALPAPQPAALPTPAAEPRKRSTHRAKDA